MEVTEELIRINSKWRDPSTPEEVEEIADQISDVFSRGWQKHSKIARINSHSKPWWNEACTTSYEQYRRLRDPEHWTEFRRLVRQTKREYFDDRIKEISETNKRPWDLMEWVKQCKLPPAEAIQGPRGPCHNMEDL